MTRDTAWLRGTFGTVPPALGPTPYSFIPQYSAQYCTEPYATEIAGFSTGSLDGNPDSFQDYIQNENDYESLPKHEKRITTNLTESTEGTKILVRRSRPRRA